MSDNWLVTSELGWAAGWQLIQVTAVIVAAMLTSRLLGRRFPRVVYVVWLVVLIKCLTPPCWYSATGPFCWIPSTVVAPERNQSASDASSVSQVAMATEGPALNIVDDFAGQGTRFQDGFKSPAPSAFNDQPPAVPADDSSRDTSRSVAPTWRFNGLTCVMLIWLAGAVGSLLIHLVRISTSHPFRVFCCSC